MILSQELEIFFASGNELSPLVLPKDDGHQGVDVGDGDALVGVHVGSVVVVLVGLHVVLAREGFFLRFAAGKSPVGTR